MRLSRGEILYRVLKLPVKFYLKYKFNIQVENNPLQEIQEPYLLLGHHVTAFDPVISNAYANRLIRYVAADANLDSWLKRTLLNSLECIPISKNKSDMRTIHEVMKELKMGHPVGLYPEGGRNWDGATDTIIPSTAKLIKMMKVPVYATFYKGGYLSKPRWASFFRRGKVAIEVQRILDRETIKEKSSEELYKLLVDKLNYNEFEWQRENRVIFKGKNLAEGIERLLYICPECHSVNTIKSSGDKFHCSYCGKEYSVNHYGEIEGCEVFTETVSWNKWQYSLLPGIIKEGFCFSSPEISLEKINVDRPERDKQRVKLEFSKEKLALQFENGETEAIDFTDISGVSITFMDVVEFFAYGIKYRLVFNPKKHMSVKLFYDLLRLITA
jgi:1-acyl-sn-glycerol-3-phosphate acyltransferase